MSLFKLHVHLGDSSVGKKWRNLQKWNFVSSQKIMCEEAFQDRSKSCVYFGGYLKGSNKEKMGRQQKDELI